MIRDWPPPRPLTHRQHSAILGNAHKTVVTPNTASASLMTFGEMAFDQWLEEHKNVS